MEVPTLRVTPDDHVTVRYAGASGDFNPIHYDEAYARHVGLPGTILHGLYTMALVARAQTEAAGSVTRLRTLSVQFRGMGRPGAEIAVTSNVLSEENGEAVIACEAQQSGTLIVRNGEARVAIEP